MSAENLWPRDGDSVAEGGWPILPSCTNPPGYVSAEHIANALRPAIAAMAFLGVGVRKGKASYDRSHVSSRWTLTELGKELAEQIRENKR